MVRQFDEDAVLEKVLEVFWNRGWQATSMADLAAAVNVQRGSLYHAYGGKEHLFELAFDRYATRVLAESRAALDAPSARLALKQFFDVSIASMTADTPPRGCFTTKTAVESDAIGERMQNRVRILLESLEALVAEALSRDGRNSSLADPPDEIAKMVIAFTRGLAVMERIYHEPKRLHDLSESLIDLLVQPLHQNNP
ncbi:TetR/AcrR family transcriptional regulator [Rhodoferax sp. U11-2br]|uniref:TetR/AcrR family transcriptional regulator n=1 Tax=Rhodoferax sp. U11-2br TaxID=2838878 RepID=UPI002036A213|nr:helix-turn-helix domain-containing protein [Rhodoferax sp. U11-2br]